MMETAAEMPGDAGRRGNPPKYDWDTILNGEVHIFGVQDVPSTPRNFGRQVRLAAARRGIDVSVVTRQDLGVYVQARGRITDNEAL